MAAMQNYDSSLQMFVQTNRPLNIDRLIFLRWLAEADRLEHTAVGPASGPATDLLPKNVPLPILVNRK